MRLEELCDELGISEGYAKKQWKSIVQRYEKIGITLVKVGKPAADANYGIKNYGDDEIRWEAKFPRVAYWS